MGKGKGKIGLQEIRKVSSIGNVHKTFMRSQGMFVLEVP
jgi:hypothetical protein